ncbi:MAG: hypothetical protein SPG46_06105 [Alistipes sp.]|nr:hypothetical protein [Alistipes sp.]MDY5396992.1 hypothetical protein [Alistipes sp.]
MRFERRHIVALLLLALFSWYWSATTLFPHAHHIDGRTYVHSHPFSGGSSGNPSHSHTPQQFQLISHLSLLVIALVSFAALALRLLGRPFVFGIRKTAARQSVPVRLFALRAPPAC